jgi:hypothetical protein
VLLHKGFTQVELGNNGQEAIDVRDLTPLHLVTC